MRALLYSFDSSENCVELRACPAEALCVGGSCLPCRSLSEVEGGGRSGVLKEVSLTGLFLLPLKVLLKSGKSVYLDMRLFISMHTGRIIGKQYNIIILAI